MSSLHLWKEILKRKINFDFFKRIHIHKRPSYISFQNEERACIHIVKYIFLDLLFVSCKATKEVTGETPGIIYLAFFRKKQKQTLPYLYTYRVHTKFGSSLVRILQIKYPLYSHFIFFTLKNLNFLKKEIFPEEKKGVFF